jgi:predicted NACHT family NTPase
VIVLVTSRIAVSDRVRYPDGTIALRLEPFRDDQIGSWLRIWNANNEQLVTARGLRPLTAEVLSRHRALASEPLLLLMLAMYDADANALQRGGGTAGEAGIDETSLYEGLLTSFAAREIAKSRDSASAAELPALVEQELQRLSLIAFSIINRRRQWVTEAELDTDLAALLGRPATQHAGFRTPLTQAEIAIGRFFFVQRAQAMLEGSRMQTFEFLHATFAEYLAARLTVQLATDLLGRRSSLIVNAAMADDDLLYGLLSFAPLSSRQILRFLKNICQRQVPEADRRRLADLLIEVFAAAESSWCMIADVRPGHCRSGALRLEGKATWWRRRACRSLAQFQS